MHRLCFMAAAVAASGAALADGGEAEVFFTRGSDSAWHFTIGPVMAPRVRVKISGPRQVKPPASLPNSGSSSGVNGNVAADPSAGFTDREYADGYVRPDEGTDDPDSMIPGLTWDWAADDVQAQHSGGAMEFRTEMARWEESVSSSAYGNGSSSESDRDILLGVEAMGGWTFLDDEIFEAAIDAGFRFYGSGDLEAKSKYGTSVSTTRNEYRYVDSYDASGWTDVPSGAHTGTPGGPGRVLGATPTRREELMESTGSSEVYWQHASTKLDYRIWDLRLGPTMGWKATDFLTIRGGVYGLLGLVDAKLNTSVNTDGGSYGAKKSRCEAVFGMAAGISAQINFTENLFLLGGAEYDWWTDDVSLRAGGASSRIELSDFTVSLALGMEF